MVHQVKRKQSWTENTQKKKQPLKLLKVHKIWSKIIQKMRKNIERKSKMYFLNILQWEEDEARWRTKRVSTGKDWGDKSKIFSN